ncbi:MULTISPECIES: hypothetical protein [Pseudoalteromonas]|uniref:phage tail tube protein n=1 Tax=Pseudoalteromonas TaxID=53246 RepID=UPI000299D41E|nr:MULTISPECIES: hypothetical protein [Pseudoalteromonas]PHI35978.1 hypothetical protein CBQ28_17090 [Pseudoalteromonas sp. GCY]QQQ68542.1 hypothetical protein JJQ94_12415 [Pseudoalteromonas sp. GCY]TMN39093.1 hypothetical protein CWC03_10400 [Pseudoalteromonas sp. S2755]
MSGLLVAGNFFIDRLNPQGQSLGIFGPINMTKLSIKTEAETKTRASRKKESYGQALDDVKIAKPAEVSCEFDDQPSELLAMALMGKVVDLNEASGTVTDAAKTLPANQGWLELGHKNLAAEGLTVKQATTTLTLGTDFEINYALGLIRSVKGGEVDAGGSITVSYQHNARSGKTIQGGIESQVRARIFGEGTNLANGKAIELEVYDVSLMPDKEIDFAASEFVSGGLAGTAKLPAGKATPFTYTELDA